MASSHDVPASCNPGVNSNSAVPTPLDGQRAALVGAVSSASESSKPIVQCVDKPETETVLQYVEKKLGIQKVPLPIDNLAKKLDIMLENTIAMSTQSGGLPDKHDKDLNPRFPEESEEFAKNFNSQNLAKPASFIQETEVASKNFNLQNPAMVVGSVTTNFNPACVSANGVAYCHIATPSCRRTGWATRNSKVYVFKSSDEESWTEEDETLLLPDDVDWEGEPQIDICKGILTAVRSSDHRGILRYSSRLLFSWGFEPGDIDPKEFAQYATVAIWEQKHEIQPHEVFEKLQSVLEKIMHEAEF